MQIDVITANVAVVTICPSESKSNIPYTIHVSSGNGPGNGSALEAASLVLSRGSVQDSNG